MERGLEMMNNEVCAPKAPKQKRMALACDKCRILKVKCIPTEEGKPCVKCAKSRVQCVVPEPKRPARLAQRAKPRIVDLESKLNDILDLLSSSNAAANVEIPVIPSSELSASADCFGDSQQQVQLTTDNMDQEHLTNFNPRESIGVSTNVNTTEHEPERAWEPFTGTHNPWITDLGLSSVVLQHLLDNFRRMNSYFPFVLLPDGLTATSIAEDRPFLLLAALTSASSKYPHLQNALMEELKETLCRRVIMAGERDLDLLQGLLVHLAWFHFHLIPRSQQTYRYLQIAISMVIDLGLDQSPADGLEQRTDLHLRDSSLSSHQPSQGDACSREARRAYLGCYYLSTTIATSTGKPNNFQFSEYMRQCAMTLQQEQEFESDQLIYPLIKLQHLAEGACEIYRLDRSQSSLPRLHTHAERLMAHLEEWRAALPTSLHHSVLLRNGYHAVKIRIQEMGLVYRYGRRRPFSQESSETLSMPAAHTMLIANLIKCVGSAKGYLDSFLAIPTTEYNSLPISEWYRVILATFVLYKLSVGLPEVPEWNADTARQTVNLEEYLSLLICRLKSIQTDPPSATGCLFAMLPEIMESVKTSYASARERPSLVRDGIRVHRDLGAVTGTEASSGRTNKRYGCPGFRNLERPRPTSSTERSAPDGRIAAEIESIENEKFWSDLFLMDDTFAGTVTT